MSVWIALEICLKCLLSLVYISFVKKVNKNDTAKEKPPRGELGGFGKKHCASLELAVLRYFESDSLQQHHDLIGSASAERPTRITHMAVGGL